MTGLSQCVIQGVAPKDVPETLVNINKAVRVLILSSQHDYITPKLWHLYQHRDHFWSHFKILLLLVNSLTD